MIAQTQIVDRASAELGLANEELIPLWEDHRSICRFESDTSPSYLDVARALLRIARDSPVALQAMRRASTHSSDMGESGKIPRIYGMCSDRL
jgi:hypothetical protein